MRKKRYLCCTLSLSVMPQTVVLTLKPEEAADVHRYAPLAARAAGIQCFDTVFTNLDDQAGFEAEVLQNLSLIHI